jgi:hypothetical protein
MKIISTFWLILTVSFFCPFEIAAQKQAENRRALETVKTFYRFHFSHDRKFNRKQVRLRRKFLTAKLYAVLIDEIDRSEPYEKEYPGFKGFITELPFQPEKLCRGDYRVRNAEVGRLKMMVRIDFVHSKSNCAATNGISVSYKVVLIKTGGRWLIDNVLYDNGSDLIRDLKKAQAEEII